MEKLSMISPADFEGKLGLEHRTILVPHMDGHALRDAVPSIRKHEISGQLCQRQSGLLLGELHGGKVNAFIVEGNLVAFSQIEEIAHELSACFDMISMKKPIPSDAKSSGQSRYSTCSAWRARHPNKCWFNTISTLSLLRQASFPINA